MAAMQEVPELTRSSSSTASTGSSMALSPSNFRLAVAAALNLPLIGILNGGPNLQKRFVEERGLSWEEAAGIFDIAFTAMTYGGLVASVVAPKLRILAVGGMLIEFVGLIVLGLSWEAGNVALGLGLVGMGGVFLYFASLRLMSTSGSTFFAFLFPVTYTTSAYTSYALMLPGLTLDVFCGLLAVMTAVAAGVGWWVYGTQGQGADAPSVSKPWTASGLKEPRYWAFCFFFAICTGGLTWSTGCYDGTVALVLGNDSATGEWLTQLFPLIFNASFLWVPLFGIWVDRHGLFFPGIAVALVTQLMLGCMAFPSEVTLSIAMMASSASNALLYSLQVVYLQTFPAEEFPALLSGTIAMQALALLFVDFLPKQGVIAARAWLCATLLAHVWPLAHAWSDWQKIVQAPCATGVDGSLAESLAAGPPQPLREE